MEKITYKLDEQENIVQVVETTTIKESVVDIKGISSQIESLQVQLPAIEEDYQNEVRFVGDKKIRRIGEVQDQIRALTEQKEEAKKKFPHIVAELESSEATKEREVTP